MFVERCRKRTPCGGHVFCIKNDAVNVRKKDSASCPFFCIKKGCYLRVKKNAEMCQCFCIKKGCYLRSETDANKLKPALSADYTNSASYLNSVVSYAKVTKTA